MVEAEFTLFEMKQKGVRVHASEPGQSRFGITPEAFDAVDMVRAVGPGGELISDVIHPQVLFISQVDQPVVSTPAVGVDDAVEGDFAPNSPLQHGLGAIRNQFGVDLAIAFEDSKDRRLPAGASTRFAFDAARAEVTFIHLDGAAEGIFDLACLSHPQPQRGQEAVDGVAVQPCQLRDLHSGEVGRHMTQKATKNSLRDS